MSKAIDKLKQVRLEPDVLRELERLIEKEPVKMSRGAYVNAALRKLFPQLREKPLIQL